MLITSKQPNLWASKGQHDEPKLHQVSENGNDARCCVNSMSGCATRGVKLGDEASEPSRYKMNSLEDTKAAQESISSWYGASDWCSNVALV